MSVYNKIELEIINKLRQLKKDKAEILEALTLIVEIGKRDMTNPKYDAYFIDAKEIVLKYNK